MKTTAIVILVILGVIVAAGWALFFVIKKRLREFSRAAFGTDSLQEGMERNLKELSDTPKSVSGMTRIYLPQIQEDFPEFSLEEMRRKSENLLVSSLLAVTREAPDMMAEASEDLREQIRLWVENNRQQGVREQFQAVRIHQTEITRYRKDAGYCVLILQSSVEYQYSRQKCAQPPAKETSEFRKIQTRYNQEWMYVQDISRLPSNIRGISFCCPNCGAPVTGLGEKVCEYCGSAIIPVNIRVWSLNRIEEA